MWQHTLQHRKCPSSILSADPEDEDVLVTNLTLLYLSRVNSDPGWFKKNSSRFYYCEKTENCIAVLLYFGYGVMAKAHKKGLMWIGLDKSQNKAVNFGVNTK